MSDLSDLSAGGLENRPAHAFRQMVESTYFKDLMGVIMQPPPVTSQREPGHQCRDRVKLKTNAFEIGLPAKTVVYRYDVTCVGRVRNRDRPIEFTKKSVNDIVILNSTAKCRRILQLVIDRNRAFFGQRNESYWYDLQNILFTKNLLDIAEGANKQIEFTEAELVGEPLFAGLTSVLFSIMPVRESFIITLDEIGAFIRDVNETDRSLQQFLEILTSQHALMHPEEAVCYGSGTIYLMKPSPRDFTRHDSADLGDGKYLGIGCSKSVRFIEGASGRDNQTAALVVDLKKTAFHGVCSVIQKAFLLLKRDNVTPNDVARLRVNLQGLTVETHHTGRTRQFVIDGFIAETPAQKKLTIEGKEMTLQEYYVEKYTMTLKYPNSPLIESKAGTKQNFYPLELCFIVDGQRVSQSQQTPDQIQKMIRQCAVAPADRNRQIGGLMRGLNLTSANSYHAEAGVTITQQPLQVDGRLLAHPSILYGQNKESTPDQKKATWRLDRNKQSFLKPAKVNKWTMIAINANRNEQFNLPLLRQFCVMLIAECRSRGMEMSDPNPAPMFIDPVSEEVEKQMEKAKEKGIKFIFFITNNNVTNLHQNIKVFERRYEIVTQDLKMGSALDVVTKNKRLTMENIVSKTNMKNGGVNYTIRIQNRPGTMPRDRLVIGLSMNHPKPQAVSKADRQGPGAKNIGANGTPSVLGVAANFKTDPWDFAGDCLFQPPNRDERIGIIQPLLRTLINQFEEARGMQPREIIVYRNGGSEGQYRTILDLELLLIRSVVDGLCGQGAKITLIVVQKMHNMRLTPDRIDARDKAADQNVKPGTVVDSQITHPIYKEFYLNSHVALQGSARTPRYTVLHDDLDMTLDEVEALTYNLTFAHQIVNLTTSLPAPVYIAAEYAERGHNLYVANSAMVHKHTPPASSSPAAPGGFRVATPSIRSVNESEVVDYNRLMADLSYGNSEELRKLRVNA